MKSDYSVDMFKQLQEVMAKCDSLSQEIKSERKKFNSRIKSLEKETECIPKLREENRKLKEKIVILEKENKELREENEKLKNEVDRLKSQINKDSNNSSNPPSSDIKPNKKVIPNNREKTSKKVGGQIGHKGYNLSKEYVEKNIKQGNLVHEIKNIGKVSKKYVSKYVLDIDVKVKAIEYRFYENEQGKIKIPKEFKTNVQYGEELKTMCVILNTNDIVPINKLTKFVSCITHGKINLSNGAAIKFTEELSEKLKNRLEEIENKVLNSEIMYTDATSTRCDGKNVNVRNYSTEEYTLLKANKGKGKKYIEKTNILNKFMGTIVHDHETVIYNYGKKHVECNVHISRYLKGNHENTKHKWDKEMKSFLNGLNKYKNRLIEIGVLKISDKQLERYSKRYDEILKKAEQENIEETSRYYQKEEKKLIRRLKKYKDNHLMFIYDFSAPFDNNLSERELRHVKIKQKVSGQFKSKKGLQNYLDIKSYIITCCKKGVDFYIEIKKIFEKKTAIV